MATILYFDTSTHGAGALLSRSGHRYTLHLLRPVHFGTSAGDAALAELFAAARDRGATVAAEIAMGNDRRGHIIRAAVNAKIGVLKDYARRHGLTWAGVVCPSTAKLALTGHGRASKAMMVRFANRIFTLMLTEEDEHQADAIGGAMAGLDGRFMKRNSGKARAKTAVTRTKLGAPSKLATSLFC